MTSASELTNVMSPLTAYIDVGSIMLSAVERGTNTSKAWVNRSMKLKSAVPVGTLIELKQPVISVIINKANIVWVILRIFIIVLLYLLSLIPSYILV
jgi:hypothetical protein